jgi:hypothetical protein
VGHPQRRQSHSERCVESRRRGGRENGKLRCAAKKHNPTVIPAQGTFQKTTRRRLYRRNLSAEAGRLPAHRRVFQEKQLSVNPRRKDSAGTFVASFSFGDFLEGPVGRNLSTILKLRV